MSIHLTLECQAELFSFPVLWKDVSMSSLKAINVFA